MSMKHDDPDHWAYNMRRCPMEGCRGVVDDECTPPHCCACATELPDGPGKTALPAPSGRKLQADLYRDGPTRRPENVVSLEECIFCGAREVETNMGPHRFVMEVKGKKWVELLTFPALHCLMCDEGWTDHRAEGVRDASAKKAFKELGT